MYTEGDAVSETAQTDTLGINTSSVTSTTSDLESSRPIVYPSSDFEQLPHPSMNDHVQHNLKLTDNPATISNSSSTSFLSQPQDHLNDCFAALKLSTTVERP